LKLDVLSTFSVGLLFSASLDSSSKRNSNSSISLAVTQKPNSSNQMGVSLFIFLLLRVSASNGPSLNSLSLIKYNLIEVKLVLDWQ
jgi:hypothetical protein